MALPIIESPTFSVRLPSTGKNIEYRPFLVKEEKILLMAQESGENRQMVGAMKDLIKACTFGKLDPNSITTYDLEFLFLKLRAKSVGETSTVKVKCEECGKFIPVEINLDSVEMPTPKEVDQKIMLTDNVGIMLRHIRVRDLANVTDEKKAKSDLIVDTVIASIEYIFDANGTYLTDETPKEELVTFVNSLNRSQVAKIEKFIEATPKVELEVKVPCTEGGHENTITLSGVQSFFG